MKKPINPTTNTSESSSIMSNETINEVHTCLINEKPALKMCLVGIGGAGGRLVNAFKGLTEQYDMESYYPCVAINSNSKELKALDKIPEEDKIELKSEDGKEIGGCGHDPETGVDVFCQDNNFDECWDKISSRAKDCDIVIVFAGLGGGTGTGIQQEILGWQENLGVPVAAVCTLPERDDIQEVRNAYSYLARLAVSVKQKKIGSVFVIDNNKIKELWQTDYKLRGNLYIASCLHDINILSNLNSIDNTTNYDRKEYLKMLATPGFSFINKIEIDSNIKSETGLQEKIIDDYSGYLSTQNIDTAKQLSLVSLSSNNCEVITNKAMKEILLKAKEKSPVIEEQYIHCVRNNDSRKDTVYLFVGKMDSLNLLEELNDILQEHQEKIDNEEKRKLNLSVKLDVVKRSALPDTMKKKKPGSPVAPVKPRRTAEDDSELDKALDSILDIL